MFKNFINFEGSIIWLFNIGIEKEWYDTIGFFDENGNQIINHIEEIMFMIANENDYIILRKKPNAFFLKTLLSYGFKLPKILVPEIEDERKTICELVLSDRNLITELKNIAKNERALFIPYGVSIDAYRIATVCNLNHLGATPYLCKKINSKIFSRHLAESCGFPVSKGIVCKSYEEVINAYDLLSMDFEKIIIKNQYGASGSGSYLIESLPSFENTKKIIFKNYQKKTDMRCIVEGWYQDKEDYSYQIYVSPRGDIKPFSLKKQLLKKTIYNGSLFSTDLNSSLYDEKIYEYGFKIGRKLFQEGYFGIVGIDTIKLDNNTWIPIIEINARCTLATYLSFLSSLFPNRKCLTFFYDFYKKTTYKTIIKLLDEKRLLYNKISRCGVICYTAETIELSLKINRGRAFFIVFGMNSEEVFNYQKRIIKLFSELKEY